MDLHRDAGDPAGDVRDARGVRAPAVRRHAAGHDHADRRTGRDGRRAAARRHDERRRRALHRRRPHAHRAAHQDALPRSRDRRPRDGARVGGRGACERRGRVDRAAGQLRRGRARAAAPGVAPRHRHRSDERARPAGRIRAGRAVVGGGRVAADERSRGLSAPRVRVHGRARRGDGRLPGRRRGGVRLREQPPRGRRARRARARSRVRVPRVRAGVRAAVVLRGQGPVPLGGALGRSGGHREDRPRRVGAVPRRHAPAALAPDGRGARRVPGAAGAHLLARVRRSRQGRAPLQRDGRARRARPRRS